MAERDDRTLDEGTRRTLAAGRKTAGDMLVAARSKARRIFIVFVAVLLVTVLLMRGTVWPTLKADLLARGAEIVVITPFDVILLQAKIGLIVGILATVPMFVYYARDPLKRRGWYPEDGVATWKLAGIGVLSIVLFAGGVVYSYTLFFPIMFDFLAENAISAGLSPTYSLVDWTQFILILALSFGLAAQLPLVMTALSYAEIVPYETFRDRWKYAIVGMFGFGALFSPPDPFTQVMWAAPLVALYAVSLYISKVVVTAKRGSASVGIKRALRRRWNLLGGAGVLGFGLGYAGVRYGGLAAFNGLLAAIGSRYRLVPPGESLGLSPQAGFVLSGLLVGVLAIVLAALYVVYAVVEATADELAAARRAGDPTEIDLGELDAAGVRAAPPEAFAALEEEDALELANEAMAADRPEKARAILDRFDEAEAADGAVDQDEEVVEGTLTSATTGIVDAVSEEETDEEDIGGYYYDLAFIADSLRSKAFRVFGVFIGVLAGVFYFLYQGGIGTIKDDFLRRLPQEVIPPEGIRIVTLHPVEALIFEVKIATLLGAVATLPLLLYYAWPAVRKRGLAGGDRRVFFGWAGALAAGLVLGSAIGYAYIAPAAVSYFVVDALRADMVITYRVSNFFWLIFLTTVGIGLLLDVPVTMVLFHRARIVTYRTMRERWRGVTLAVAAAAGAFTPAGVLSMVLFVIPVMAAYGLGLGALWVLTLGGRRAPKPAARSG